MDWSELLAVQGTLKSLLQHHSSKASSLQHSAFFINDSGKIIALTRQNFVGKGMSLVLNMLSRLVTAFLSRGKHLLISWLQPPSAVILKPKKIKSVTVSIVSPSLCHEIMGPDHEVSWSLKKAEHQRIDAFELWCWRRLLRVPWTARSSNQSV